MKIYKLGEVCIHGGLTRKCEACELADQFDEAKLEISRLREALENILNSDRSNLTSKRIAQEALRSSEVKG